MSGLRDRVIKHRRSSLLGELSSRRLTTEARYPSLPQLSNAGSQTLPRYFGRELVASSTLHLNRQDVQSSAYVRPAHSSLSHEGFSAKNHEWSSVQRAIVSLFQQKKLSNVEMALLCENVRAISSSELGPFIYDYYKNQLMPRGLRILRDKIEVLAKENGDMLRSLGEVWDNFYQEILPLLQVVLRAIQIKDHNVRNVTLLGFRDIVLLKIDVEDILDEYRAESPPAIHQMLLVLQSVKDSSPPNERFLQLERLVARVVHPYLGHCGLYTKGNPEPSIRSAHAVVIRCSSDDEPDKANVKWLSQTGFAPSSPASHQDVLSKFRNAKGISHNRLPSSEAMTLEPVLESIEKKQHPRQVALSRKISDARRHSLSEIMG